MLFKHAGSGNIKCSISHLVHSVLHFPLLHLCLCTNILHWVVVLCMPLCKQCSIMNPDGLVAHLFKSRARAGNTNSVSAKQGMLASHVRNVFIFQKEDSLDLHPAAGPQHPDWGWKRSGGQCFLPTAPETVRRLMLWGCGSPPHFSRCPSVVWAAWWTPGLHPRRGNAAFPSDALGPRWGFLVRRCTLDYKSCTRFSRWRWEIWKVYKKNQISM